MSLDKLLNCKLYKAKDLGELNDELEKMGVRVDSSTSYLELDAAARQNGVMLYKNRTYEDIYKTECGNDVKNAMLLVEEVNPLYSGNRESRLLQLGLSLLMYANTEEEAEEDKQAPDGEKRLKTVADKWHAAGKDCGYIATALKRIYKVTTGIGRDNKLIYKK